MSSSSHSPGQSAYGSGDKGNNNQSHDNGPLGSLNLNFIKSLTERKATKDGQAPKRRGPKPDSKPALTRRQELNRQAQRTHRERKEFYIKALEDEVLRLKEAYTNLSHEKDRLAEENKQLRGMVGPSNTGGGGGGGGGRSLGGARLGIGVGSAGLDDSISNPSLGYSGSIAGSNNSHSLGQTVSTHTTAYTPPPLSGGTFSASPQRGHHPGGHSPMPSRDQLAGGAPQRNPGIDYDQAGIDFVLNLEKPCMAHLPWLLERRDDAGRREACGHALMASCPPDPFQELTPDVPFGTFNTMKQLPRLPGDNQPPAAPAAPVSDVRTWELSKADLTTLLQLSKRLDLDGEITPVMAWGMVLAHPRLGEMTPGDFARITEELTSKIRCFGFGAVLEEFEVRDALENIFSTKAEYYPTAIASNEIAMAY